MRLRMNLSACRNPVKNPHPSGRHNGTAFHNRVRLKSGNAPEPQKDETRQKIVDVFTVQPVKGQPVDQNTWDAYLQDLNRMMEMFQSGQRREARGLLAKRVGAAYQAIQGTMTPLMAHRCRDQK